MNALPDVVALIRREGIYSLGGYDGCLCTHFHVQQTGVDVSCHKSERMIRVHSRSLFYPMDVLRQVAEEVQRQLMQRRGEGAEAYPIRYCDQKADYPPACVYCASPREDASAYLCAGCLTRKDAFGAPVADDYNYSRLHQSPEKS